MFHFHIYNVSSQVSYTGQEFYACLSVHKIESLTKELDIVLSIEDFRNEENIKLYTEIEVEVKYNDRVLDMINLCHTDYFFIKDILEQNNHTYDLFVIDKEIKKLSTVSRYYRDLTPRDYFPSDSDLEELIKQAKKDYISQVNNANKIYREQNNIVSQTIDYDSKKSKPMFINFSTDKPNDKHLHIYHLVSDRGNKAFDYESLDPNYDSDNPFIYQLKSEENYFIVVDPDKLQGLSDRKIINLFKNQLNDQTELVYRLYNFSFENETIEGQLRLAHHNYHFLRDLLVNNGYTFDFYRFEVTHTRSYQENYTIKKVDPTIYNNVSTEIFFGFYEDEESYPTLNQVKASSKFETEQMRSRLKFNFNR